MNKNQNTPKESNHEQPDDEGLDAVTCSRSSDTPETDACYSRAGMMLSAQVDELDACCRKLEREIVRVANEAGRTCAEIMDERDALSNALSSLVEATDRYGMAASMTHPRLTRALSAARKLLPENANMDAPADDKTLTKKSNE